MYFFLISYKYQYTNEINDNMEIISFNFIILYEILYEIYGYNYKHWLKISR